MHPLLILVIETMTFLAVAGGVYLAAGIVQRDLRVRRRLGGVVQARETASVVRESKTTHPFLKWIEGAFLSDPKDMDPLRTRLVEAGFHDPSAPMWFVAARFSLAIVPALAFIALNALFHPGHAGPAVVFVPLLFCGLGLVLPGFFLRQRASAVKTSIQHQFPDALDLILICVESGLGLEAAFQRVGREVRRSHPAISHAFMTLSEELAAGRGRADALRGMAARLNVDSVKAFVALVVQTEALGVSIADSLRTYSAEMRQTRFLNAEEKAMRIPVLMTVPLVACFMPVIVVALLLPPMIDTARTLIPALKGGLLHQ